MKYYYILNSLKIKNYFFYWNLDDLQSLLILIVIPTESQEPSKRLQSTVFVQDKLTEDVISGAPVATAGIVTIVDEVDIVAKVDEVANGSAPENKMI